MTSLANARTDRPIDGDAPETLASMRRRIAALGLDLSGLNVITEAATGIYACTAVLAAMAGAARVSCVARDTANHGSFDDAVAATMTLAVRAGVADRIHISRTLTPEALAGCDILTNSGHLRPITAERIARLPAHAVIALMFEAWEFRDDDLDLAACRDRGIRIAAVNECHPDVAVFPFLGPLCVRLLADAGLAPAGRRIAVVCDNPFASFLQSGLTEAGAQAETCPGLGEVRPGSWDAIVVALDPTRNRPVDRAALTTLAAAAPNALLAQFWGDIEPAARQLWPGPVWPMIAPGRGHMGILLSALGPEPIIRLQTGGLRAAELVLRAPGSQPSQDGVAVVL